jgi:uncharacterized protein (TIGR02001 family)
MKKGIKKIYCLLVTALVLSAPVVSAEEGDSPHEFSANVALTTDYMYRGLTQSNEDPAIQGGFDYSYTPFGFYAGVWASSLEFVEEPEVPVSSRSDTSVEIDFYGGFSGELPNGIGWDIGGLYYFYPSTDDFATPDNSTAALGDYADQDFFEVYGGLSYTFGGIAFEPSIGANLAYSPDYYGEDGDSIYVSGTLDLSLPHDFGISFLYGHLDVDGDKFSPGGYDYGHYVVGINKSWKIFGFDLSYYETTDETDCGGSDACEALVFTVSSSF